MPRFYFKLRDNNGIVEDEEGVELPSLTDARQKAIAGLRDIVAGEVLSGQLTLGSLIEIENEEHALVMTVPFNDAVTVTDPTGQSAS